jgi:hypothetical protein
MGILRIIGIAWGMRQPSGGERFQISLGGPVRLGYWRAGRPAAMESVAAMFQSVQEEASRCRLLVCIVFAYRRDRIRFLYEVMRSLSEFMAGHVDVIVMTNTDRREDLALLEDLFTVLENPTARFEARGFVGLDHPFALPWCAKPIIRDEFLDERRGYTHFVHIEDDIRFTFQNFCYFLKYRQPLAARGLIPSFVRVEYNYAMDYLYCTDHFARSDLNSLRQIEIDGMLFANFDSLHNAMHVLDRDLAMEYVGTRSFDRYESEQVFDWWICERAAMGLCFENIPEGFISRLAVPVLKGRPRPATCAWVYHLANNYTNEAPPRTHFGKLRMDGLYKQTQWPELPARRASAIRPDAEFALSHSFVVLAPTVIAPPVRAAAMSPEPRMTPRER